MTAGTGIVEGERSIGEAAVPEPPRGRQRLRLLGPGFLWMVSAAGSGELLFTPRIGALYGYALLWALVGAVVLKWFINREIGRFAVCTGASVLAGFARLPGPRRWALWVILVPQVLVAVASIAGLAGAAATALILLLPGDVRVWMVVPVLVSTALVVWGRYQGVERVATFLAVTLGVTALAAAASVGADFGAVADGAVPRLPAEVDFGEVLPWLGFMLSGAAGLMWYSYWVTAKGYGAAELGRRANEPIDPATLPEEDRARLRGWLAQMTLDTTVAVVGALLVTLAFLILGVELLRPEGLVPEENRVAETLGELLGGVWGRAGFWFMVLGVFVGFWDTVLTDQDGFGRLFADGTRRLLPSSLRGRWTDEATLQRVFVVVLVTIVPIALYLAVGEPVELLKLAGAIEAAHIPVVAGLTLYLNHRDLPPGLRPSRPVAVATAFAGLAFAAFAVIYVAELVA